jgi:hypothetical protein
MTLEDLGRPVHTLVVRKSSNGKTGPAACTYRTQASCPPWCAFYSAGCYARGRIFGIARHSGTVDDGAYTAVRELATLPADRLIRFNVSGDYLDGSGRSDLAYIEATNAAAHGRPRGSVISYTHAWQVLEPRLFAYIVNASCDSAEDLERARDAGWNTVAVRPAEDIGRAAGLGIVPCVAQVRPGATCDNCRLCGRARVATIGFEAHGGGRAQVLRAIAGPRVATVTDGGRITYR